MKRSKPALEGGLPRRPRRQRTIGLESLERRDLLATLDPTFGIGGRTLASIITPGATNATYGAVTTQPDGKYVIVGTATNAAGNRDFAIARLNANGTPDPTFNGGEGVKLVGFDLGGGGTGNNDDIATSVVVQPNGRIVVAGVASGSHISLTRLLPSGEFDLDFESDGKLNTNAIRTSTADNPNIAKVSVALQTFGAYAGNIVVAAGNFVMQFSGVNGTQLTNSNSNLNSDFFSLARITFTGNTFEPGTPFGPGLSADTIINDLAIDPLTGKIVVAGLGLINPAVGDTFEPPGLPFSGMGVARLNPDGSNDFSFGTEVNYSPYNVSPTLPNLTATPPTPDTNLGDNPTYFPVRTFSLINTSNVTSSVANGVTIGPDGTIYLVGTESLGDRTAGAEGRMLLVRLRGGIIFRGDYPGPPGPSGIPVSLTRYGNHPFWGDDFDFSDGDREGTVAVDGVIDTSFTAEGVFPVEGIAKGLDVDYDEVGDRIVAIGYLNRSNPTRQEFAILRTDRNGNIDFNFANSFGVDTDLRFQTVGLNQAPNADLAQNVILLADGRIVVAGSSAVGTESQIGLVRFLTDEPPLISIGDVTVTEGDSGTVNAVFTVSLSGAYRVPITVNVSTADGTGIAGTDFTALPIPTILTFVPGVTSLTVTVPVIPDFLDEADETFTVNLSGAVIGIIDDSQGVGTIVDNDPPHPTISVNDVTVTEGHSGTANAVFTVSLSRAFQLPITVNVSTADGTGIAGTDYTALPVPTTLTFAPGVTSLTVTVPVISNLRDEPDRTFLVNLSDPVLGLLGDSQGVGTIVDDEPPPPTISVNDVTVTEGHTGTVNAVFTVSLSGAYIHPVSVNVSTANGTGIAGTDFLGLPVPTTLTFAPGVTSLTVTVPVISDFPDEPDETFTVNLSDPVLGLLGDGQGVGTIVDNDPPPDVTPPVLMSVTALRTGRRRNRRITAFELQFSEALDPSRAQNFDNYILNELRPGEGRLGRPRRLALREARFDPTRNVVTLVAAGQPRFQRGALLTVNTGVTDRAGNPLDGDANGTPGPSILVGI